MKTLPETETDASKWPTYSSHADAQCFEGHGKLDGKWRVSGFAKGNGEFEQACPICGMSTWYDIESPVVGEAA